MEFPLRPYQREVVSEALRGRNSIIWLPTGAGKTRAAVYVAKHHLSTRTGAKVAVLVNKIHLVDQHYENEFKPKLGDMANIQAISGDSKEKDFFACAVKEASVVICTAQILENALTSKEENKHVELTDFTLLIIDECHHTHKDCVYNKIMERYIMQKIRGERNLPQILGLTASPGTGGARTLEGAVKHVLQICANLDSVIVSSKNYVSELTKVVPKPMKRLDIVQKRYNDRFGNHLKLMMKIIHGYMGMSELEFGLRAMGTQEYEADVVQLEKKGVQEKNRLLARCALHLRKYNDALLINDTVRMMDALRILEEFYISEGEKRLDETDDFLSGLFYENRAVLIELANNPEYENPKLAQLESTLLQQFRDESSRGILFVKTREGTRCLCDWVHDSKELQRANIHAAVLVGAGIGANNMTQNKQKDTIQKFRDGNLNLLISTTVAEEGLDVLECNVVIRYGLLTNEIAQQQAKGRARAQDSVYSVIAEAHGREMRREKVNEILEDLTKQAIEEVQRMEPMEFQKQIIELQNDAMRIRALKSKKLKEKWHRFNAAEVEFSCRSCFNIVARGDDMRLVNDSQHIIINPNFKRHYKVGDMVNLSKEFEEWEPGRKIACANCGNEWGMEIKLKQTVVLPCVSIESFSMNTPLGIKTVKKWKDVEFPLEEFDYAQYVDDNYPDLFQD